MVRLREHQRMLLRRPPSASRVMPLLLARRRAPGTGMENQELVNILDRALAIAADFSSPPSTTTERNIASRFPPAKDASGKGDDGSSSPN